MESLEQLLKDLVSKGGSDLHLIHDLPPYQRVCGIIAPISKVPIDSETITRLVAPHLTDEQRKVFEKEHRCNSAFTLPGLGRFRMNICRAQGSVAASVRSVPTRIFPLGALGLPQICETLTTKRQGIIFITGATGAGKSTTMAAMLEYINHTRTGKIVTIEDPIETVFKPDKCIFVQREVGMDVPSFEAGIQDAMRQDQDIIAIGEMRTSDSIQGALTAAETGHLVITTLHTPDAAKTAQRVLSASSGEDQNIVLDQLCNSLEAVISQELLPRADGMGLVPVVEVLLATTAVKRSIRERKLEQIYDALQTGVSQGMISKDAALKALVQKGFITKDTAMSRMRSPEVMGTGATPAPAPVAAQTPAWRTFPK